jgi:hypothetical protein
MSPVFAPQRSKQYVPGARWGQPAAEGEKSMRYFLNGIALAAAPEIALAQSSQWGAFEAGSGSGVGVQAADGSQLMLRCDKPGANEVYAMVAASKNLVPPASTYVMRPVKIKVDDRPAYDDRWRFLERTASAVNLGSERSLTRLLTDLADAKTLKVELYPDTRYKTEIVTVAFNIEGAEEAINLVYEKCQDQRPS